MTKFPGMGYHRGNVESLVKDSIAAFNALPPEKQEEMRKAQRESWVRGELAMGNDADEAREREKYHVAQSTGTHSGEVLEQVQPSTPPSVGETLTQREVARQSGFTGDQCSNCFSMKMKVSGHCLVCTDCGTTTGCS